MGKHEPMIVWMTRSLRAKEWIAIQTVDKKRLKIEIKSGETIGQVSATITRDTAERLVRELTDLLESTR